MIEFMRTGDITLFSLINLFGTGMFFLYILLHIKEVKTIPGRISKSIINFVQSKNTKIPVATILAVIHCLIFTLINYHFAGVYGNWFGNLFDRSGNYYGVILFGPLVFAVYCFVSGIDIIKAYDIITPSFPLALTFSKFACFTAGCCNGMEWEHGLYSYYYDRIEFPVQLVEMALAFIIFVILILIKKKLKRGTLYPLYILLYSATRFFSEFTRAEPDIVGNLKFYHLCCLAGIGFSIVFMLIAIFLGDKISRLFTLKTPEPADISAEISYEYHYLKNKLTKKDKKVITNKKKRRKK